MLADAGLGGGGSGAPPGTPGDAGAMLGNLFQNFHMFGEALDTAGTGMSNLMFDWIQTSKVT